MRTTVSLDPDLDAEIRRLSRERGISFKEALNSVLRAGLETRPAGRRRFRIEARRLGLRPGIDLDKALRLAGAHEDDETIRKLELGK